MNYNTFQVNQGRVVISSGGGCGHNCIYCISTARSYKPETRDPDDMISILEGLCRRPGLETIQLGYDAEPFRDQPTGVAFLRRVAQFGRNITFVTKAEISDDTAKALGEIYKQLGEQGKYLCGLVSMSSWDSASRLEPKAPTPERRLNTIRRMNDFMNLISIEKWWNCMTG